MIAIEQIHILLEGLIIGFLSALVATSVSIIGNRNIASGFLMTFIIAIVFTGIITIIISTRSITSESLINNLRKE